MLGPLRGLLFRRAGAFVVRDPPGGRHTVWEWAKKPDKKRWEMYATIAGVFLGAAWIGGRLQRRVSILERDQRYLESRVYNTAMELAGLRRTAAAAAAAETPTPDPEDWSEPAPGTSAATSCRKCGGAAFCDLCTSCTAAGY
jgi:hypothetical protein